MNKGLKILSFLSIFILLVISGCSNDSKLKRPEFVLPSQNADQSYSASPTASPSTVPPTQKPVVYEDDEGYIYAYKNDNFIIEYQGLVVKMYYKLIEHAFKGIITNTNTKTVNDINLSIVLSDGKEIQVSVDEELKHNETMEIASKYVNSSFEGWRISLYDNPPKKTTYESGKLLTTVDTRTTADSFQIDEPLFPVVKDYGVEINGKRFASVNQTFMFNLNGLELKTFFYWKTYPGYATLLLQDFVITNNSDKTIRGLYLTSSWDTLTRYPYARESTYTNIHEKPIDLEQGESFVRTHGRGQSVDFAIYSYGIHVYAGGPFTSEDLENMKVTIVGEP